MTAPTPAFVGRQEEGRAVLVAARAGRSVVLTAPPNYGKTALLQELRPALDQLGLTLDLGKLAPFGQFLLDLFLNLQRAGVQVPGATGKDGEEEVKNWKKAHPNNEQKARSLVSAIREYGKASTPLVMLVDDAGGISATMVPWLVAFTEVCALVLACYPETMQKAGTRRLWQKVDSIQLGALSAKESAELVDTLSTSYGIIAEDSGAYKARVRSLSAGVPGEIDRLIRYVSTDAIVKKEDIGSKFAQTLAQRQERGIALAPIFIVLAGIMVIIKYMGRARGEMDVYLEGGVGVAVFMMAGPYLRGLVRTR